MKVRLGQNSGARGRRSMKAENTDTHIEGRDDVGERGGTEDGRAEGLRATERVRLEQ